MGKKRIITTQGTLVDQELKTRSLTKLPKKKVTSAIISIQSTFNNTIITVSDKNGNVLMWSSSGSLGFSGAKKGTPFAASKVAELLADKAKAIGIQDVDIIIKGIGAGRESAIRTFATKGLEINLIRDETPIPHNGPKPKKPRRV